MVNDADTGVTLGVGMPFLRADGADDCRYLVIYEQAIQGHRYALGGIGCVYERTYYDVIVMLNCFNYVGAVRYTPMIAHK